MIDIAYHYECLRSRGGMEFFFYSSDRKDCLAKQEYFLEKLGSGKEENRVIACTADI
jgi:hypothetical protein